MLLSLNILVLFTGLASLTTAALTSHHKVRHKHNLLNLRGNHVNKIREAFDAYRNVLHQSSQLDKLEEYPEVQEYDEYDDVIDNSLKHHQERKKSSESFPRISLHAHNSNKFTTTRKPPSSYQLSHKQHSPIHPGLSSEYFSRSKRVHDTTKSTTTQRTTTTLKSFDNYDEDYDDDDNDTANRRLNDDAHVGSVRLNRDNTDSMNQPSEGESLTDFKMRTLGSPDGVGNQFKSYRNITKDITAQINENSKRLYDDALCRWPNKKVIEMPQHPSRKYTPRKYVIYRCSDDTACCRSSDKTCVAKRSEEVTLWFHVRIFGSEGAEPLKIQNHTECQCISKYQPTTVRPRTPYAWQLPTKAPVCKCPSYFDAEIDDGECGCTCREGNADCRQRFEGREGFTMSDQRCMIRHECVQPHCLHGVYSTNAGRCPDKNDKINKGFRGTRTATRASR